MPRLCSRSADAWCSSNPACLTVARHAKSVVRILKYRVQRAARRAAAEFYVVAPRAAARGFARAGRRTYRITVRRDSVIIRGVKITAPLVHACADVIESKGVGFSDADPRRPALQRVNARAIIGKLIAPGIFSSFEAAAGSALPLGLGRQTKREAALGGEPRAIHRRFVP